MFNHINRYTIDIFLNILNSGELEITVDFLSEIDKLIQLIESPIFSCKCFLKIFLKMFFKRTVESRLSG